MGNFPLLPPCGSVLSFSAAATAVGDRDVLEPHGSFSAQVSADAAVAGGDGRGIADDHRGGLPAAGELNGVRRGPAGGELDGQPDAAAVRGPTAREAGRGAGGRKALVDLVAAEADDRVGRFRRRRGVETADGGRAAADQTPAVGPFAGGVRLRVAAGDDDVLAVAEVDVGPAQGRHLAPAQRTVEEQPHDRAVDQAAALGRLLPLEAAAGPSPLRAGGEDGGALVGRQPPSLSAAGGGDFGAAEVFEGLASERPVGRLLTGVAGGPAGGGDGHRGGCLRAAGRPKMADVGGEARVIERAAVEPGGELAVCRGVGSAGIRRGVGLAELDRRLGAGPLGGVRSGWLWICGGRSCHT